LRDTDFIYDAGIDVVDGSEGNVLASSNQIRVYPIDVVKGMEFDVVFFHNIDNSIADDDLIKRYIYVGVSRAAFFLGITLNANNESITKYFKQSGDWGKVR
jgi:superfamily I DNA/RNA helicase